MLGRTVDVRCTVHVRAAAAKGAPCSTAVSGARRGGRFLVVSPLGFSMSGHVSIWPVTPDDSHEITDLHARVFGPGRFVRTAYRIREGAPVISRFCRASFLDGTLIAAIRFTEVTIGRKGGALLLGPLAVEPRLAGQGYGKRLIEEGLETARAVGLRLVVLVGDEPYYGQFGFRMVPPAWITLPGPVDPARILAAELTPGALAAFQGLVAAAVELKGGPRASDVCGTIAQPIRC